MGWQEHYESRRVTAAEAIAEIRPGDRVVIASGCAEPQDLVEGLTAQRERFHDLELVSLIIGGRCPYLAQGTEGHFRLHTFLGAGQTRPAMVTGRADYLPCHVSHIGDWLRDLIPADVVFLQVSPPGEDGLCCHGIAVDYTLSILDQVRLVIAEVNDDVPRVHGAAFVPVTEIDYFVQASRPPLEMPTPQIGPLEEAIGQNVAALVPDGATVQVGVGSIGEAAVRALVQKNDLGVHTGAIPEAVADLVMAGVINGKYKPIDRGKVITASLVGTRRLHRWAHDNPAVEMRPSTYTHSYHVLRQIDNLVAINSAIEIDLCGRINADTVGGVQLGGVGGQVDFLRAAAEVRHGRSLIVMPSSAGGGKVTRIVPRLRWSAGAVLTTPAEDVQFVVTEFGSASLRGKTARQRAAALIEIAHPKFRDELRDYVEGGALFG